MAIEDWIPDFDPSDEWWVPQEPECRDCGRKIMWVKSEDTRKWVPTDRNGQRHRCPKKVSPASEFPKLED